MRRLILFLFMFLLYGLCFSQSMVLFKGIPLGIPKDEFASRLQQKGFVVKYGYPYLEGPFFRDNEWTFICEVELSSTRYTNRVNRVKVHINDANLERIKIVADLYLEKYGKTGIVFLPGLSEEWHSYKKDSTIVQSFPIEYVNPNKEGMYSLYWSLGKNAGVSLHITASPQYNTYIRKKKILGIIPYRDEIVKHYDMTTYTMSICYNDSNIGHGSNGTINDL